MMEDLALAGYSPKTQKSYIDAVRGLAKHYMRPPDKLSEDEVRQFFLHLINKRKAAKSTVTIYLCGIKFFYETTLKRDWKIFDLVRPLRSKRLPVVLTTDEVLIILKEIKSPLYRMALIIIYACGLRISEAVCLKTTDIDGKRCLLKVHGKGSKDRYVPLPDCPLDLLRSYYQEHGTGTGYLFPHKDGGHIYKDTLQVAFKKAIRQSSVNKIASVHTLRHSYATLLLENGEDIRVIKDIIGHSSIVTTDVYTHVTGKLTTRLHVNLNKIMPKFQL